MKWRDAVHISLRAFCARHQTRAADRRTFLAEELPTIITQTGSSGLTPDQTLSRCLQELRDEGVVQFLGNGSYLLLDTPFDVEAEDLSDEALDHAIRADRLKLGRVETDVQATLTRRRKGQDRLRELCLEDYGGQCAVCDVVDRRLLIASHVLGWAEAPEHRGELANVLCLCRFHDALFELGYWSLKDDLQVIRRSDSTGSIIAGLLAAARTFRSPQCFPPNNEYLRDHRMRWALSG